MDRSGIVFEGIFQLESLFMRAALLNDIAGVTDSHGGHRASTEALVSRPLRETIDVVHTDLTQDAFKRQVMQAHRKTLLASSIPAIGHEFVRVWQ